MKPSAETIEKFRKAYFEEFGERISSKTAYEKFLNLTTLLRVILYPSNPERENRSGRKEDSNQKDNNIHRLPHRE
ncbi:MAG: hypothetical protein A4E63_00809 [Syntrophorhabdus sp. PtaU1.Bin050]|jgi:hypothetical protein|nr:MAG: hypothetical protein A4E63_00809 [Syntrophorhabdus sp. PtaU1.Bin050]